ncbi:MAG: FAD-binding oxidoreductase [Flavobacteriaceae bacterium]|nr:FAD-binding oxidoreductase [Flavobacteriaceae bacterium]
MTQNFIKSLTQIVGESNILHSGAEKERFTHIWKTDIPLEAKAVIFPSSTEEVSEIMKYCYGIKQEVIVHGGLSNLVGGTETESNQLVISLDKMNLIEEVDPQSKTITAQAGTILENMIDAAKEKNLLLPMSFGAKGSAHIGGVVSTNAGGLRVFRYGMTRQMVLGLEAVLPDGTIISSLKKIIKDNSGYDLKQLFIGSEGTLGIVTKVIFRLSEAPTSRSSAIVGIDSYEQVIDLLKYLEKNLAGTLSGFELMWKNTYAAMTGDQSHLTAPMSTEYNYYVFVESLGSQPKQDYERLENLIGNSLEMELIQDGVMMQSERELNSIWQIREDVSILAGQANFDQHFDISIPIPLIGELVDQAVKELNKFPFVERIFTFGHVADGNIHFIIGKKENNPKIIEAINEVIYRPLKEVGGSVSAEHGIGIHKKAYLATSRSKEEIDMMKTLKLTFDPLNILNPGRIF